MDTFERMDRIQDQEFRKGEPRTETQQAFDEHGGEHEHSYSAEIRDGEYVRRCVICFTELVF